MTAEEIHAEILRLQRTIDAMAETMMVNAIEAVEYEAKDDPESGFNMGRYWEGNASTAIQHMQDTFGPDWNSEAWVKNIRTKMGSPEGYGMGERHRAECPDCVGAGLGVLEDCQTCDGVGEFYLSVV